MCKGRGIAKVRRGTYLHGTGPGHRSKRCCSLEQNTARSVDGYGFIIVPASSQFRKLAARVRLRSGKRTRISDSRTDAHRKRSHRVMRTPDRAPRMSAESNISTGWLLADF